MAGNENSNNWSASAAGGHRFPDGRHVLRLGDSFFTKAAPVYHTMRYDFKPASVGDCKETYVEVAENHEVTVTVPKLDEIGEVRNATMFKGPRKPYQKECLLIYNHETGEFVLEQLSYNIQLKKTRGEVTDEVLQNIRETRKKLVHSTGDDDDNDFVGTTSSMIGHASIGVARDEIGGRPGAVEEDVDMLSESSSSSSSSDSESGSDGDSSDEGDAPNEIHSDMDHDANEADHYGDDDDEIAKTLEAELDSAQSVKDESSIFNGLNGPIKASDFGTEPSARQASSHLHEDLALSESDED